MYQIMSHAVQGKVMRII